MEESHRHEAQIYQLRALLRGISPLIWSGDLQYLKASTSIFHRGPRPRVAITGRMYGCNQSL
jgi:hypothetical protein